jgi:hypothetical protein
VALTHPASRHGLLHEGVVIEVVPPGRRWASARVWGGHKPAAVTRYVVQTWDRRVVRSEAQLLVVAP